MNKPLDTSAAIPAEPATARNTPPLLFEMMRSFATLARTLNLSHAVKEMNSTRQTVRRHIAMLEAEMGVTLFEVDERQYHLTTAGKEALPGAEDMLARARVWARGDTKHVSGLMLLSHEQPNGWAFYQQQQPLTHVWDGGSSLLREALIAWGKSGGQLECEAWEHLRPYLLVYRDSPNGWICVELGEESFYALWYGWINARSSIGRTLGEFPGGDDFARLLGQSFDEIQQSYGARLDEVVTMIPREQGGTPIPTAYKRLLMGSRFPDGTFALIAAVDRSDEIRIAGLDQSILEAMPEDAVSSFVPP